MDPLSPYNNENANDETPWELIRDSIENGLPPEDETKLQRWLSLSPANRDTYWRARRIWKEVTPDYDLYRQAAVDTGWGALRQRMDSSRQPAKIVRLLQKNWMVAAATVLLIAGAWWYSATQNTGLSFRTADNEQRTINLPDGSTIAMEAGTQIRLSGIYNQSGRTVVLTKGKAFFDVQHRAQLPFTVDLGVASIKDIGTSFTVQRNGDTIQVQVLTGRVAFTSNADGRRRELSAGMGLTYSSSGQYITQNGSSTDATQQDSLLRDIRLDSVISAVEKHYGRQVLLKDTSMAPKQLTVGLKGQSLDQVIKIICTSLDLVYEKKDGVYILKK